MDTEMESPTSQTSEVAPMAATLIPFDGRGVNEVIAARAACEKAILFEFPEEKQGTSWIEMRNQGWHDHFNLAPRLPLKGEWDFEIREMYESRCALETMPAPLYDLATTCFEDAQYNYIRMTLMPPASIPTTCKIKLGLCMSLKNRARQVQASLPISVANLWAHRSWCKLYIVDFDSTDGIVEWIKETLPQAMSEDLLCLYTTKDMPYFHVPIAKNTAHRVAIEDNCHILVNLDADNIVDEGFAREVMTRLARRDDDDAQEPKDCDVVHYYNKEFSTGGDGTYGRIAQFASDFEYVRGYDENTMPAGNHDCDLLHRFKMITRRVCGSSNMCTQWWNPKDPSTPSYPTAAIPNPKTDTKRNVAPSFKRFAWKDLQDLNCELLHERRVNRGEVIRNREKVTYPYFGCENVDRVLLCEYPHSSSHAGTQNITSIYKKGFTDAEGGRDGQKKRFNDAAERKAEGGEAYREGGFNDAEAGPPPVSENFSPNTPNSTMPIEGEREEKPLTQCPRVMKTRLDER